MKKLLLGFAFITTSLFSQTMTLLPEGLRSSVDNTKSYVVVNADGMTAEKLYTNAYNYIQKAYVNPQAASAGNITNEYLSVNTYKGGISHYPNVMFKYPIDVTYSVMLTFKDNRIKIEFGNVQYNMITGQPRALPFVICGSTMSSFPVYTKKGKLLRDDIKVDIERYFNAEIKRLSKAITTETTKKDEW